MTSTSHRDDAPFCRDRGIVITGRLIGAEPNRVLFADDLVATLAAGDAFVALINPAALRSETNTRYVENWTWTRQV